MALQLKIVISLLLTDPGLSSVHTPCLPELILTATLRSTQKELATEWRGGVVWALRVLGVPVGQVREFLGEVLPVLHGQSSYWSPDKSEQEPHPFNSLWYFPLSWFSPSSQSWSFHFNILGALGEKQVSLVVPCAAGEAGYSPTTLYFPHRGNPQPPLSLDCATFWRGVILAKFFIYTLMHSNLFFFFPLWKSGLLQRLSHPWVSVQVRTFQVLPDYDQEWLQLVHRLLAVPQPIP